MYFSFETSAMQTSMAQAVRAVKTPIKNMMIQRVVLIMVSDQAVFFAASSLKISLSNSS